MHYLWNTAKGAEAKLAKIVKETGLPLYLADHPVPACFMDYPSYDEGAAILADLVAICSLRELTRNENEIFSKAWVTK